MKKYGLHGCLRAKPGNGESLAGLLLEAATVMRDNEACHLYLVSQDHDDPEAIYVTEVWDSKEDHDESLSMEGVPQLISAAMPLLEGKPSGGTVLDILGGKGIN